MKKTLTQITLLLFAAAISLSVSAQNNKLTRTGSNLKANFMAARVHGKIVNSAHKNGGASLFPAAISGYYAEDFEAATFPPAGWQAVDVLDASAGWMQSNALPYAGLNSAYCGFSPIGIDGEDWLILPQFTVAAGDSFSFWLAAEYVGFPPDTTYILVSTTDSLTTSFTNVVATLAEGNNYPGTAGVYQFYTYDLSSFAGQDVYIAFQNKNTYGDGIFIDHVSIGTKPPLNAASVSIDLPNFVPVGTMSPMATFLNDGTSTQSFPVTMTITGGYTSTKSITNLAAGSTTQVTFDPWTPVAAGTETVSVQTQLAGDGYTIDDSISRSVAVLEPFTNYGWISKAPMNIMSFDPASAAINGNDTSYLFAFGGISGGNIVADAGQFFNFSNSWAVINPMNNGNFVAAGASFNNKVYVIGGYNPPFTGAADNQIYDLATTTWSNGTPMPSPAGDYAFGIYHDSLFYYMGGYDGATDLALVQIYNASSDSWTSGTAMPAAAAGWRGGIAGDKIVVTGGYNQGTGFTVATYMGAIDASDPSIITWTQWDDYPLGNDFRTGGGASIDPSSGLVIFTGGDPVGNGVDVLDATFAFDVNSGTWKIGPPKITPANNLGNLTAIVDNDSLYMAAVGGYDGGLELDKNEWLNLGPYTIPPVGINTIDVSNVSFTCYPNPFLKFTDIKFSLAHNSNVKAVIVDVLGNVIEELCNKNMNEGNHQLKWNAAGYSKGVYFCKLFVNDKEITQKLLKY